MFNPSQTSQNVANPNLSMPPTGITRSHNHNRGETKPPLFHREKWHQLHRLRTRRHRIQDRIRQELGNLRDHPGSGPVLGVSIRWRRHEHVVLVATLLLSGIRMNANIKIPKKKVLRIPHNP